MLGTAFESSRRVQAGWTRESELKLRSDWKLSFLNDVKGLDPCMANSMDMVESNVDANYNIEDMKERRDEGQSRTVVQFVDLLQAAASFEADPPRQERE